MKVLFVVSVLLLFAAIFSSTHAALPLKGANEACGVRFETPVGPQFQEAVAARGYRILTQGRGRDGDYLLNLGCRCSGSAIDPEAGKCTARAALFVLEQDQWKALFDETATGGAASDAGCIDALLFLISSLPLCHME